MSEHDMGRPGKELFVREFFILKGFRVGAPCMLCLLDGSSEAVIPGERAGPERQTHLVCDSIA